MAADLAAIAYDDTFLDFDKGTDRHLIAHITSVQVEERRKSHTVPQPDVGRDHLKLADKGTALRAHTLDASARESATGVPFFF
jgi:hypothetical protein